MGKAGPRPTILVALVLGMAGCTSDGRRRDVRDDPLLGVGARAGNQPVAVATANPNGSSAGPAPPAYQPRPAMTAALPTSNALVAGGFQPLSGGNELRIGNGQPQQPAFSDPRSPQPAGGTVPAGGPIAVPPPGTGGTMMPVSGSRGGALDQAYTAVAARDPRFTKLQYNSQTREYTFVLSVPSKLNAAIVRTVEATAPSAAEAIYRALEQLDGES